MNMRLSGVTFALGLLLVACGTAQVDSGADESDEDPTTTSLASTTTTSSVSPTTTNSPASTTTTNSLGSTTTTFDLSEEDPLPEESELIEAAIADLAQRLHVEPDAIEVLSARRVQWPDGSIGCPEEGMIYTQAVVDGAQVLLGYDGRLYDYHADSGGRVFLCPSEDKDGGYEFVPPPGFDAS